MKNRLLFQSFDDYVHKTLLVLEKLNRKDWKTLVFNGSPYPIVPKKDDELGPGIACLVKVSKDQATDIHIDFLNQHRGRWVILNEQKWVVLS